MITENSITLFEITIVDKLFLDLLLQVPFTKKERTLHYYHEKVKKRFGSRVAKRLKT